MDAKRRKAEAAEFLRWLERTWPTGFPVVLKWHPRLKSLRVRDCAPTLRDPGGYQALAWGTYCRGLETGTGYIGVAAGGSNYTYDASGESLDLLYVVAHEYAHHIQHVFDWLPYDELAAHRFALRARDEHARRAGMDRMLWEILCARGLAKSSWRRRSWAAYCHPGRRRASQ